MACAGSGGGERDGADEDGDHEIADVEGEVSEIVDAGDEADVVLAVGPCVRCVLRRRASACGAGSHRATTSDQSNIDLVGSDHTQGM